LQLSERSRLALAEVERGHAPRGLLSRILRRRSASATPFGYISGWPGDTFRYRCEHQAEVLQHAGLRAEVYQPGRIPYQDLLSRHRIVVVHRLPCNDDFEAFVSVARRAGLTLVFDTDDLVFDAARLHQMHAFHDMDAATKDDLRQKVHGCKRSIELCDGVTVSTDKLRIEIEAMFPTKPVAALRNRVSSAMEEGAQAAAERPEAGDGFVRLAYFSGTNTHEKDFAECVPALSGILREFPALKVMIVGYLSVPDELQEFSSRIEQYPFVPWRDLPALYRRVDVNLAPLEQANDFTESKSELKYLEAALFRIPTIASNTNAFRVAITDGDNGRLCTTTQQWSAALRELVVNVERRKQMGSRAFDDVRSRYTTHAAARETVHQWIELLNEMAR
jgi:glycosyltransferase involved in cell wall biosynthesis